MENELKKRLEELAQRADSKGIYTQTQFLGEGEQAILAELPLPVPYRLFGAHPDSERCIAVFGDEEAWGYPWENTLVILKIEPKDPKFADALTHRDFLGALLNLGIRRELLGDILISDNVGYLVALESIAPYLEENLSRVRHTSVKVSRIPQIPQDVFVKMEEKAVVCASARVDAVIAGVWNLSRSQGKDLVEKEKVSISGKLVTDPSFSLPEGCRVSVRGYGRFYFDGAQGETRSGRCRMKVRLFV